MQVEGFIVPVPTIIETLWFWGKNGWTGESGRC